jgi:hypothetical protein
MRPHSAEHSGCQQAHRPRVVYQHNHVYDKPFMTMFAEELPERLAPPIDQRWAHAEIDAGANIIMTPLRRSYRASIITTGLSFSI